MSIHHTSMNINLVWLLLHHSWDKSGYQFTEKANLKVVKLCWEKRNEQILLLLGKHQ